LKEALIAFGKRAGNKRDAIASGLIIA